MKNLTKTVQVFFALMCFTLLSISNISAQKLENWVSFEGTTECNKSCTEYQKWIIELCEKEIAEHVPNLIPEDCLQWDGQCGTEEVLYRSGQVKIGTSNSDPSNTKLSVVSYIANEETIGIQGSGTMGVHGSGNQFGVLGTAMYGPQGVGVKGIGSKYGVWGQTNANSGAAVIGWATDDATGILGLAGTADGLAGRFEGNVVVNGKIGIGTNMDCTDQDYQLAVDGRIGAKELKIENSSCYWADYVFEDDYDLMPISDLDCYIEENGHLPNIPSLEDVENDGGMDVGRMQGLLLAKVEELTLYMLELKKENEELRKLLTSN